MIKYLIIVSSILINICQVSAQEEKLIDIDKGVYLRDTTFTLCFVSNYFNQKYDSINLVVGKVFVTPGDSIKFNGCNSYTYVVENNRKGYLYIYFKGRLAYRYNLYKGRVRGVGICYYTFTGDVALQGAFKDGRIDGMVTVQKKNGEIIEAMKFKKGKYVKHLYHWVYYDRKALRLISKGRSRNPLSKY